eukprot:762822-Hanusia_phi.AAC.2
MDGHVTNAWFAASEAACAIFAFDEYLLEDCWKHTSLSLMSCNRVLVFCGVKKSMIYLTWLERMSAPKFHAGISGLIEAR